MMTRTYSGVGVASLLVSTGGAMPAIHMIEGYCNGAAGTQYFIQLFNAPPTSGVTVPLRSLQVLGADGYTFDKNDVGLSTQNLTNPPNQTGIYIYLSSTDAVFTTPGITADINVDVEEFELELQGTTTQSSNTPNSQYILRPDSVGNTYSLVSLTVQESNGVASRVQLFAAAPVNGASVPLVDLPIAANATKTWKFGSGSKALEQEDANGTRHFGIYVGISLTPNLFDNAGSAIITATWKNTQ